jgi:hypothetical protein
VLLVEKVLNIHIFFLESCLLVRPYSFEQILYGACCVLIRYFGVLVYERFVNCLRYVIQVPRSRKRGSYTST